MSDDRKSFIEGLGDLDWDSALDEWEKSTFVPESPADLDASKTTSLLASEREAQAGEAAAPPSPEPTVAEPSPALDAPPDPALHGRPEGTLIAPVPRELRDDPRPSKPAPPPTRAALPGGQPSSPPSMRGGLDQLFARATPSRSMLPLRAPSERPKGADPGESGEHLGPHEPEPALERDAGSSALDDSPDDATGERPAVKSAREVGDAPTVSTRDVADAPTVATRDIEGDERAIDEDDNATLVRDRDRGSLSDADTATRLPADDEMPTLGGSSSAPRTSVVPSAPPPRIESSPPPSFDAERPGSRWLDTDKIAAFTARLTWLEEEARATVDPTVRGRGLLAVSELCALVGDVERARDLATEARDDAPHLALAWRQARQLMPRDPHLLAEALDAEAASSPTPSARVHAVLLGADLLRTSDQGDAAVERWDSACKLDPADPRAPIARAALALAQDDHTSGSLRLADNSELIALDKAIATALRLRGVERPGAEVDEMPINDGLRHARTALASGDVVAAAQSAGEIGAVRELSRGALWLSAALGAAHIASRRGAARALKALSNDGEPLARRQLAARGIELGDPELVTTALTDEAAFDPAERAVLGVLTTSKGGDVAFEEETLSKLSEVDVLRALADALTSIAGPSRHDAEQGDSALARASRVAGTDEARALATVGRLLAAGAPDRAIDAAVAAVPAPRPPTASGVAMETAVRARRWGELSAALSSLPTGDDAPGAAQRHVAAALLAERAGDRGRAREAWAAATRADATLADGLVRITADLDPELDLGRELLRIAIDMPDGVASAVLRLEAIARCSLPDAEQAAVLEDVHRAAPGLGIGAFLAERVGRRKGDLDEVLRWIQERRAYATDPLEAALDAVREALLVADRDPEIASTRIEDAHRSRPDDVALRELYERLATEPPTDRGAWRERCAAAATGAAAATYWVEAALEHERAGDAEAALRAARKAAEAGDRGLSRTIVQRAEVETGKLDEQVRGLEALVATTEDERARREALERLAHLAAHGREDRAATEARHREILAQAPHHLPSLRWLEHELVGGDRDDDLASVFEQIALALDGTSGGEVTSHAQHAALLRAREAAAPDGPSAWERTHDMARLAATQPVPSLWALRSLDAHARAQKDDEAHLRTTLALLERTQRPLERAALLLRASEAATRLERVDEARTFLEQASSEDPGDVVTWGFLAEIRERSGDARGAAEACESLARTSAVRRHQLLAWHDAAKIWLDEVGDAERAMSALEAAAEIDATYADVFPRLSALYADRHLDAERARLLEKRLDVVEDDEERVALEVDLSRAFAELGELPKAKLRLESALAKRPDHTTALGALAELCIEEGDWSGAEQAYVRLARLLTEPAEQRAMFERLGEIYSVRAPNLSRAEVAFKEVLKRAPDDLGVLAKLVDVHKRQGDVSRAVEAQQRIVAATTDPDARLASLIDLAQIHETVGHDPRRSEQALDSARKEFPTSVVALRAMAEFYARQRQMPAMQILLDRAAGDARRAFAQGRFVPSLFQVLHAAFDLRGKRDAARVVAATLAAVEGQPSELMGAEAHAVDPRLDELLAPDTISPALRALLFRAGDALDAVAPMDLRILKATPLQPGTPIGATVGSVATVIGLGALQILVSPVLGRVAIPLATNPPTLLVGEGLARVDNERARMFVVVRAMKMILSHASALLRGQAQEVAALVAGLVTTFNPNHVPPGIDAKRALEHARRIGPALPRNLDPTVGVIALEAAGMLGAQWPSVGPAAQAWANRVALLAVGDPNAALDAIAWGHDEDAAPTGSEERAAWIARHPEARELMTFSVTDAYAEARIQLGLDR